MSRPASSFPAPPSRHDSAYTRRQSAAPTASGSAQAPPPAAAQWTVVSDSTPSEAASTSTPTRGPRPAPLTLAPSTRIEPAPGSPLSLAPSHTSSASHSTTGTEPESPTPAAPTPEAARLAKMQRVTRRLGEGVPAALVFADAHGPGPAQDDEARPLLGRRAGKHARRNTTHTKPQVKAREPIRAWNGPIPFDEMSGPFAGR